MESERERERERGREIKGSSRESGDRVPVVVDRVRCRRGI
jgi:hypothetical protein